MQTSSVKFEAILDSYFEQTLAGNPMMAAYSGLESGEGKLGKATFVFETAETRRARKTLAALESISPRELSADQQLDRLAMRASLLRKIEDFERGRHTFDPSALDSVLNILLHELQRSEEDPARAARNLLGLLKEVPRFLQESKAILRHPESVWVNIMDQTFQGAGSFFDALAVFLVKQSKAEGLIAKARKAFAQYHREVKALKTAPPGTFALGREGLQRRVRDELGLDYSLDEIEALAWSEIHRVNELLQKECKKQGGSRQAVDIIDQARKAWRPKAPLIDLYRQETEAIAKAFEKAEAVTFPKNQSLVVREVPEFMRHLFPTAAYSQPGAFAKKQQGVFWVNDLSKTKSTAEEINSERAQHFGLLLTCAHEAYPGHHLQFATANQHPRKWRRLFAHAIFYEGWTLWCEQMVVDLQLDPSPWLKIQQLHDALWRCHRILVDLKLQTREYSYRAAVKHMQKHLGFTKSRAEADVNWYTASPGTPMSYWLGRLENERLQRKLMNGRGWTLKQFNDWLLSFGTLPQRWLETWMLP